MDTLTVTKIQNNIYRIQEDSSFINVDAYLICGEKEAVVIDGLAITKGLYECVRKITDKPVSMIVTHGHPDHAGNGMLEFMEAGFEVFVSFKDLYLIEEMYGDAFQAEKVHNLENGMKFDLGGTELEAMAMPGHTKGSTLVYMPKEKLIFSADAIGSGGFWIQLPESLPLKDYMEPLYQLQAFLEQHEGIKIYPGHSYQIEPYLQEGQDYLDKEYVDELIDITRDIIDGKEVGEKTEIEMDMMKGIDVRTVKRRCVVDYCYDAEHILEK
ncbi:MAG: MBL fold metallo-hydrolase [Lachnospiraceae bacterium]|nr:MBL fold metallo-hydrolase [Lachnospiraceae bacterium]